MKSAKNSETAINGPASSGNFGGCRLIFNEKQKLDEERVESWESHR